MNLLLFTDSEITDGRLTLQGRRARHLIDIIAAQPGTEVTLGLLNGNIGTGTVRTVENESVTINVGDLEQPPPDPLELTLVLALPRPKMLRRTLQSAVSMGIKRICICHSRKVEKSYWQSPFLNPEALLQNTILGLEQAMDTTLPEITLHKLFKPFVEDELPHLSADSLRLLGAVDGTPVHQYSRSDDKSDSNRITLAVGPEGGFIDYEVMLLEAAGFHGISLGRRVLRVETALPALIATLTTGFMAKP